jgi:hypothetical protein
MRSQKRNSNVSKPLTSRERAFLWTLKTPKGWRMCRHLCDNPMSFIFQVALERTKKKGPRTCFNASCGDRLSPLGSSIDTTITDPSPPARFLSASSFANTALGQTGSSPTRVAAPAYEASSTSHGSTWASTSEYNERGLFELVRRSVTARKCVRAREMSLVSSSKCHADTVRVSLEDIRS